MTCGKNNNRVERLELNQKSYHGTLTTELSCLTELTMLLMSDNGIQGSIPEELGEKLTKLVLVDLSINDLKGSIPLFESSQLQELILVGLISCLNLVCLIHNLKLCFSLDFLLFLLLKSREITD